MCFSPSKYNIVIQKNDEFVYLFNSFSGALIKIDAKTFAQLQNGVINQTAFSPQELEILLKQGFIRNSGFNEYNKILYYDFIAKYIESNKLTLVIAPTLKCNLACYYCFEQPNSIIMSEDTVDCIIKYLKLFFESNHEVKKLHITWFGGEPMIAYKLILQFSKQISQFLKKQGIIFTSSMITNGTLLDEQNIIELSRIAHVGRFQITIDGSEKNYCTRKNATLKQFNNVLNAIIIIIRYAKVSIRLNCDKDNYSDLKRICIEIINRCKALSPTYLHNLSFYLAKLIDYQCSGDGSYLSQELFDAYKLDFNGCISSLLGKHNKLPSYNKTFCGMLKRNNVVIGPAGELYKCEHYIGNKNKIIGNIRNGLMYNNEMLDFVNNKNLLSKCQTCNIFPICLGGCPAQRSVLNPKDVCYYSLNYIINCLKQYIANKRL